MSPESTRHPAVSAPTTSGLPAPAPHPTLETQAFWDATAEGRLLLRRCDDCGLVIWYPRHLCPDCGTWNTSWMEASGRGTVYAATVVRRGQGPYREAAPYVVAYVELDEGPRVMTNVVGCPPEEVRVGQPVEVVFDDTGEGRSLYRFRPRV